MKMPTAVIQGTNITEIQDRISQSTYELKEFLYEGNPEIYPEREYIIPNVLKNSLSNRGMADIFVEYSTKRSAEEQMKKQ